jgi:hypothetical protein
LQGGYYNKPDKYEDMGWVFIPYYYYDDKILMPNKTKIEEELGNFVDDKLFDCVSEIYPKEYKMDFVKSSTKATIDSGRVSFVISMPISMVKGDKTVVLDLKDQALVLNSSLFEAFEIADYITKSHKSDNSSKMCINCITEMAKTSKMYVDFIEYKDNTLVQLSENHTYKEPYLFQFLNKYPAIVE